MHEGQTQLPEHINQPPGSLLGGRRKVIIGGIIIAVALGYFAFNVFQGAAMYYVTVGELLDRGVNEEKIVRVNGSLVSDSFTREPGSIVAHFRLSDGERELSAVYQGVLPDLFFNEHSQIVLEGRYGFSGVFRTDTVLVRCPSKYEALAENA